MSFDFKYSYLLIPVSLVAIMYAVGIAGATKLFPVLILIVAVILIAKPKALIILFFILAFSNGLIVKEEYFVSILGPNQAVSLVLIIYLLFFKKKSKRISFPQLKNIDTLIRVIIITIWLYYNLTNFKEAFFKFPGASYTKFYGSLIGTSIKYYCFWLILVKYRFQYKSAIITSAYAVLAFFALTLILNQELVRFGYYSWVEEGLYQERYNGFAGLIDKNGLAASFIILIGCFVSLYEKNIVKFKTIIVLFITALPVLYFTGSRAGFFLFGFIIIFFMLRNFWYSRGIKILVISLLFAPAVPLIFSDILSRFQDVEKKQLRTNTSSNRVGKWLFYLDFINQKPVRYLRGSERKIYINGLPRAAHNFYIQMIYNVGITFIVLMVLIYIQIVNFNRLSVANVYYSFIPLIFITFFVSDFGMFHFAILAISIYLINEERICVKKILTQ